jgi:signal transduction histidine kinase
MGVQDIQVVEEQSALLRVAMLVARDTPLDQLFNAVSAESARVLGIDSAGVLRYLGGERAVVVGVWVSPGQRYLPVNAELDFERNESALGRAQMTGQPARVARHDGGREGGVSQVMKHLGMRTSIACPVFADGVLWGALVATAPDEEALPAGCERRLTGFAEMVGQALVNDRARTELAASRSRLLEAADEKRQRLERELHEGAHQHVVALALKLRVALGRSQPESAEAEVLRDLLADAMEANTELSELARELHPAVLTERGLAAALQALGARAELPVMLHALPGRRYRAVIEATAHLMVAEALSNTDRHAHATEAIMLADDRGDRLVVEVRDNGIGGAQVRSGGGLECISDRAAALGGSFALESPKGGGTTVRIELPVD